jgi:hypothetical protein
MVDLAQPVTQRATRAAEADVALAWLWGSALAMFATLAHVLIDMHIGLWGETSREMSVPQAGNVTMFAAIYAWWAVSLVYAWNGDRWALRTLLLFAFVHAFLLNGLVALFAAPPPSAAFPYQDIAHVGSLVAGGFATLYLWRPSRRRADGGRLWLLVVALLILVPGQVFGGIAFFAALPS